MPIDPYSSCPGGSGKKIKFCCPELVGELQKIERMLGGKQHLACLNHVERLEKERPDRACLLETKTLLLRVLGRVEEAVNTAAAFREKHPQNQVALAESAMLAAVTQGGRPGMELLSRALAASGKDIYGRVYEAMDLVGRVLAAEGQFLAARAIAFLQASIDPKDPRPRELLLQLNSAPDVPLVLKDDRPLEGCSDNVPWKAAFEEARGLANQARWADAAKHFQKLAEQIEHVPAVWRNLAMLRAWLADTSGCIDALRKFASLDVPLEDAVEAESLALFLCDDPLGDQLDVFTVEYEVKDADTVEAALSAAPQAEQLHTDLAALANDDEPPPQAAFLLFHTAASGSGEPANLHSVPRLLCQVLVFGRQTDRRPRLEVIAVVASDLEELNALLVKLAGGQLDSECQQEVTDHISATRNLLTRNWRLPEGCSREVFHQLTARYVEDTLLNVWPQSSLGLLDGKSPEEAAAEDAYRVKLLAAIMVVEFWLEQIGARFDCNRLRSRLGLPTLEPIDPQETPIDELPLVRLSRVKVEALSDNAVLDGYRRAVSFGARQAARRFAQALVDRPSMAGREQQLRAFAMLARTADDLEEALKYVERGRQAAEAAGQSSASWDLLELSFRFERAEGPEISRLLKHLESQHLQEPGVAQALTDLLVQVGVLGPDGTLAVPIGPPAEEVPSIVVPGDAVAEPGKLWTPDSQKPAGEKPKIWTPGMD